MKDSDARAKINKRKLGERFAIELGPAIVFVAALQLIGINPATVAFVIATVIAAGYSWSEQGHLPYIPVGMVMLAAIFGAATILLGEAKYIEIRATVVNAGGAVALLIGLLAGKLFLKRSLQEGFSLTDEAWRALTIRMIVHLFIMAALNEAIWRNFSTETWGWFKAASPLLNLVFLALNWPLIRDHLSGEGEVTDEPPAGPSTTLDPAYRGHRKRRSQTRKAAA